MTDHERDTLKAADEYRDARIEYASLRTQVRELNEALIALQQRMDTAYRRVGAAEAELHRVAEECVSFTRGTNGVLLATVADGKVGN